MLLYVIGPSGVGKTTLAEGAKKAYKFIVLANADSYVNSIDAQLKSGYDWPAYWAATQDCFIENENKYGQDEEKLCLVDVGAGCLQTDNAFEYFRTKNNVLLVYDTPVNIYNKNINRPNSYWIGKKLSHFKEVEFSNLRKRIYGTHDYRANIVGLNTEEAINIFIETCNAATASLLPT